MDIMAVLGIIMLKVISNFCTFQPATDGLSGTIILWVKS